MSVTELRPVTLGGSDAGAAAGIDPWKSPVALWIERCHPDKAWPPHGVQPVSEQMRWGHLLQPVIGEELRERGYVARPPVEFERRDPERPWLVGHPDGQDGDALVEIKTVSAWGHADAVPLHHAAQCQVYMHLTGLRRAVLATLVGGQRLEVRDIDRDDDAIEVLLDRLEAMHGYIVRDEPPPVDGSDSTREALALLHPHHEPGSVIRADKSLEAIARELRQRRQQAAIVKGQQQELENILKAAMGDAETLIGRHDQPLATWKAVESRRFDSAEFKRQRPELYDLFRFPQQTRRFTVHD